MDFEYLFDWSKLNIYSEPCKMYMFKIKKKNHLYFYYKIIIIT